MLLYLTEDQAKNILGNDNLTKVGIQIAQKTVQNTFLLD